VQFVLNYEEGGENCVLHGDPAVRAVPVRDVQPAAFPRAPPEHGGIYEYGSRAGAWRLLREFEKRGLPLTVFGVSMALQRHPELTQAFGNWATRSPATAEWIHYQNMDEPPSASTCAWHGDHPAAHGRAAAGLVHRPRQPQHPPPGGRLRRLRIRQRLLRRRPAVLDEGEEERRQVVPHLVVPYTLDCNDMRFALPQGFSHADPFFQYLRDSFDVLYAEGDEAPKMMSIGMHCRLLGRPGRMIALQRFLDHIAKHDRVWVCRRIDIARHWKQAHPYQDH
jgi:allantoinase